MSSSLSNDEDVTNSSNNSSSSGSKEKKMKKKPAVRYAEKRRTSTCLFGDRVAAVSVELYKKVVVRNNGDNKKNNNNPSPPVPERTCIATIVAYDKGSDKLCVVALGVGTKFLQESVLKKELYDNDNNNDDNYDETGKCKNYRYGERVRDCHAEVLARRAFRRYLSIEILRDLRETQQKKQQSPSKNDFTILQRVEEVSSSTSNNDTTSKSISYRVRPGVSLHFYSSSAPCGNAVLKKFASMRKERFRNDLSATEWPCERHEYTPGHSIKLGQFSLLLKKDNHQRQPPSPPLSTEQQQQQQAPATKKAKKNGGGFAVPPGTIAVVGSCDDCSSMGSIHTCSDKLLRWNCLGLQGSLLSSLIDKPIYMSTLTVGRKFSEVICRRAVCCRVGKDEDYYDSSAIKEGEDLQHGRPVLMRHPYRFNHPAVLGTGVYMDETGVIDMKGSTNTTFGQDVRFHSSSSWAWWRTNNNGVGEPSRKSAMENETVETTRTGTVECIDGSTGYLVTDNERPAVKEADVINQGTIPRPSLISTAALTGLYMDIKALLHVQSNEAAEEDAINTRKPATLLELRRFKQENSPEYEHIKERLFTKHPLLRQWMRRQSKVTST